MMNSVFRMSARRPFVRMVKGCYEFWPGLQLVFPAVNHRFIFSLSPLILTTLPYLNVNVFQNITKACSRSGAEINTNLITMFIGTSPQK